MEPEVWPQPRDVVVRVMGGLGNQLFQYAFGLAKARQLNGELWLDASHYSNCGDHTGFELASFVDASRILYEDQRERYRLTGLRRRLRGPMEALGFRGGEFKEQQMGFDAKAHRSNARYFRGYWQSPAYWVEIQEEIAAQVQAVLTTRMHANEAVVDAVSQPNAVALHVRRGDYVSVPSAAALHGIEVRCYYRRAVQQIVRELGLAQIQFYVFSDDEDPLSYLDIDELCEAKVFAGRLSDPYTDLFLMSRAPRLVIANSSYSWWAGFLGGGVTYAPSQWVRTQSGIPERLYPEAWRVISIA